MCYDPWAMEQADLLPAQLGAAGGGRGAALDAAGLRGRLALGFQHLLLACCFLPCCLLLVICEQWARPFNLDVKLASVSSMARLTALHLSYTWNVPCCGAPGAACSRSGASTRYGHAGNRTD